MERKSPKQRKGASTRIRGHGSKAQPVQNKMPTQGLQKANIENPAEKIRRALERTSATLPSICSSLKSILVEIAVFFLFAYGLWHFIIMLAFYGETPGKNTLAA